MPDATQIPAPVSTPRRVILLVLGAALYALAFPLTSFWPLIFVAMACALVATRSLAPRRAFAWGVAFGFAVGALGITWFWQIFAPVAVPLWLIFGAWFGAFFAGRALLERGLPRGWALVGTVVLWTAVEFFRAECWPLRCTFLTVGHALAAGNCPLRIGARWIGSYGLGAFVMAANVALASAAAARRPRVRFGAAAGVLAAVALACLGAAWWMRSVAATAEHGAPVRVALVQCESGWLPEQAALTRRAAPARPQWVLWPEISVFEDVKADAHLRRSFADLAGEMDALIGVGSRLDHPTDTENFWNAYLLFDRRGEIIGEYHKVQPVPMFRDGVPGGRYPSFATEHGRLGVVLCYDGDFSWISRRVIAGGAQALSIPTYDMAHWGARMHEQHLGAHVLRAVENGRWVMRPASSGPSALIDPTGRVRARLSGPDAGLLTGVVHLRGERTVFQRGGWLLPYACQAAAVALVAWALLARRRRRRAG